MFTLPFTRRPYKDTLTDITVCHNDTKLMKFLGSKIKLLGSLIP